jgi:hypothetical protein
MKQTWFGHPRSGPGIYRPLIGHRYAAKWKIITGQSKLSGYEPATATAPGRSPERCEPPIPGSIRTSTSVQGQSRRSNRQPATAGLPRTADISIGMSQACQTVIRRANQFDRFDGVHVAHSASNSAKTRARKDEFRELIQSDLGRQSATRKYFYFVKSETVYCCRRHASARGAYASSRTWGGMRWTR